MATDFESNIIGLLPAGLVSLFNVLSSFVKDSTRSFDDSHNYHHALKVTYNAFVIAKDPSYSNFFNRSIMPAKLLMTSMLHDVCDDKYKSLSISKSALIEFISTLVGENSPGSFTSPNEIMKIIDSVSYSKQVKGNTHENELDDDNKLILQVLRDADRIEAIGLVGLERCYLYTKEILPSTTSEDDITAHVVQHCYDKLLRLYGEGYISTSAGRQIAAPLHQYIVDFVTKQAVTTN